MNLRKWISNLFHNSFFSYAFFGGCTTLVNLVVYNILRMTVLQGSEHVIVMSANAISIFAAILFAYFTNSRFVFWSKADGFSERCKEFFKFVSARMSTLFIEVAGVTILASQSMDDRIAKFIMQFVVLALNYIFSRFLIFRNREVAESV